jgi:GMP synthase-like glutamine amidotransferase
LSNVLVIQNCPDESPGFITEYLKQRSLTYDLIQSYEVIDLPPSEEYGPIISLGSPLSVTTIEKHEHLMSLHRLIKECITHDHPFLGICFSSQLLAMALGAAVGKNPVKEIGLDTIMLSDAGTNDPLFDGIAELVDDYQHVPVFQWHGDTFATPSMCDRLAFSERCHNQAFRFSRLGGIQFHLDTIPDEVAHWCDVYKAELDEERLEKESIVRDYVPEANRIMKLCTKLLDNFFVIARS